MSKNKKHPRVVKSCAKCDATFKVLGKNPRTDCYKCVPKCRENHIFDQNIIRIIEEGRKELAKRLRGITTENMVNA
jgi:hypothetical protein